MAAAVTSAIASSITSAASLGRTSTLLPTIKITAGQAITTTLSIPYATPSAKAASQSILDAGASAPNVYSASDPLVLFIIQVSIIVALSRLIGVVLARLRQPKVRLRVVTVGYANLYSLLLLVLHTGRRRSHCWSGARSLHDGPHSRFHPSYIPHCFNPHAHAGRQSRSLLLPLSRRSRGRFQCIQAKRQVGTSYLCCRSRCSVRPRLCCQCGTLPQIYRYSHRRLWYFPPLHRYCHVVSIASLRSFGIF